MSDSRPETGGQLAFAQSDFLRALERYHEADKALTEAKREKIAAARDLLQTSGSLGVPESDLLRRISSEEKNL